MSSARPKPVNQRGNSARNSAPTLAPIIQDSDQMSRGCQPSTAVARMATIRPEKPASATAISARESRSSAGSIIGSFPDAETGEDAAQQVVAGNLAGDAAQCHLGVAQLFGHQFAGAAGLEVASAGLEALPRIGQGLQMPAPRGQRALAEVGAARQG